MISISRFFLICHYCRTLFIHHLILHLILHLMSTYVVNDKDGFVGIAFRSIFGRCSIQIYSISLSLVSCLVYMI
jgi:hypothetical protein